MFVNISSAHFDFGDQLDPAPVTGFRLEQRLN